MFETVPLAASASEGVTLTIAAARQAAHENRNAKAADLPTRQNLALH